MVFLWCQSFAGITRVVQEFIGSIEIQYKPVQFSPKTLCSDSRAAKSSLLLPASFLRFLCPLPARRLKVRDFFFPFPHHCPARRFCLFGKTVAGEIVWIPQIKFHLIGPATHQALLYPNQILINLDFQCIDALVLICFSAKKQRHLQCLQQILPPAEKARQVRICRTPPIADVIFIDGLPGIHNFVVDDPGVRCIFARIS